MRQVDVLDSQPKVIHCNVNIVHLQLRDLLQPAGSKGKVLFVNRQRIDCADFTTRKVPTVFCTLDFLPVCLTTGSGLVAAGGQQSELDIRPLHPLPGGETTGSGQSGAGSEGSSGSNEAPRRFPRWHLRTPTGGSINNSICIQPDLAQPCLSSSGPSGAAAALQDRELCLHREKRRKEAADEMSEAEEFRIWQRDEPSGRLGAKTESQRGTEVRLLGLDAVLQRNLIGVEASEEERQRQSEEKQRALRDSTFTNGLLAGSSSRSQRSGASVRVLVSNNDHSVKEFRLRPPMKWKQTASTSMSSNASERIESGLPGLSRLQTVEFPTCINHSSFSPDGRHLVCVGDTPEVFLYSVDQVSGELTKIATYTASSDASFSTSWSPDGMQFAIASQDGLISVWDVRSACKVASLETSQMNDVRGSGAARVVKWSPRGDLLAYSEHKNYVHVVDTTTFTTGQRIKVPAGGSAQARNASAPCTHEEPSPLRLDQQVSTGDGASNDLLESTSPARFTTNGRGSAVNGSSRSWLGAARGSRGIRSPLDRALLGEWSSNRRGPGGSGHPEVYIDDRVPTTFPRDSQPVGHSSTSRLARTVDSIMATLDDESSSPRGTGIWSLAGPSRRPPRDDGIDISGLTWDPDGEFLYVSTEDLIAQYTVLDLRRSFCHGVMR